MGRGFQFFHSLEGISPVFRSVGALYVVRVPGGDDPAGRDHCNRQPFQFGYCRLGLDTVEKGNGIFRFEGLPPHLLQEHFNGALIGRLRVEIVFPQVLFEAALRRGQFDLLAG